MSSKLYGVAYEEDSSRGFVCRTVLAEEKERIRKIGNGRIISIVEIESLAESTAKCPRCKEQFRLGDKLCFGYRLKTVEIVWIGEKSFYATEEEFGSGDWYWSRDHHFVHLRCVDLARLKALDADVEVAIRALHAAMKEDA